MAIPGVKVTLRGQEYEIPPLTLDAYERFLPQIQAMAGMDESAVCALMRDVIFAALVENYPDASLDSFRKRLDVANLKPTFFAVLGKTGEGKPPGEAGAPQTRTN